MEQLWQTAFPYWHFIVRAMIVYIAVLILLRIGGKREIGQMGAGEFVAILLISNAVQNSMNGGDNSVTGGLIMATVIILLSTLAAYLTYRSRTVERFIQGSPSVLICNGQIEYENLRKEWLNVSELKTMLRHQGIHALAEVEEAILESDGSLSLTRATDSHKTSEPMVDG